MKPLLLWGGVDISPHWYNETPLSFTQHPNIQKDKIEFIQATNSVKNHIPIIGVCRGAQLLCVLNKGKLVQHGVPSRQHHPITTKDGHHFDSVIAAHHQIMVPSDESDYELLAWNPEETQIWTSDDTYHKETNCPEVIWFPKTRSLAIQSHPEWASDHDPFKQWVNGIIKQKGIDYVF